MLKLLTSILPPWLSGKYHRLSDNCVESEHYEIRMLIRGQVAAIFFDRRSNVLLVDAGRHLWKIDKNGTVVDTFIPCGKMYSSGLSLDDDGYDDWVITGDKSRKKYPAIIDANAMSERELADHLDRAEIVEFDFRHTNELDWPAACYLWSRDGMTVMDITRHRDRVDTHCDRSGYSEGRFEKIRWHDSCLEGYEKKSPAKLDFLGQQYIPDWDDQGKPALVQEKFARDFYHFEDGFFGWLFMNILGRTILAGLPGALPTSYWYGIGYYRLNHRDDVLNYKAFTSNEDNEVDYGYSFYKLPEGHQEDLMMIGLNYRSEQHLKSEQRLNRHYEQDIGLYVLRKKDARPPATIAAARGSNMVFGHSTSYRTRNPWQPVYTGMIPGRSVWGDIHFYNSKDGCHHYLLDPAAVPVGIHAIPRTMTFHWNGRNSDTAFKLYLSDGRHVWYHIHGEGAGVSLEIHFDEAEIVAAFQQLDGGRHPLQLDVHMEEIFQVGATLSIWLRKKNEGIELKRATIACRTPEYGDDQKRLAVHFEKSRLKVEYSRVAEEASLLQDYLELAQAIVARRACIQECVPLLMQQAAELVLKYTGAYAEDGRYQKEAETVFYYFADKLFPYTGREDDTDDVKINVVSITSNTLAFAILSKNERLGTDLFEKVLGRDFDVTTLKNGTLAYNVACYHAVHREKQPFLAAVKQALLLGKTPEQFMADSDFSAYRADADFQEVLASASTTVEDDSSR